MKRVFCCMFDWNNSSGVGIIIQVSSKLLYISPRSFRAFCRDCDANANALKVGAASVDALKAGRTVEVSFGTGLRSRDRPPMNAFPPNTVVSIIWVVKIGIVRYHVLIILLRVLIKVLTVFIRRFRFGSLPCADNCG